MPAAELAERLKLDASTLSRTVDGLVKAGLLNRLEDPRNRRRTMISLTEPGQEACASVNRRCDEFYLKLFQKVPADRHEQLLEAIGLLAEILAETRFEGVCETLACGPCREQEE